MGFTERLLDPAQRAQVVDAIANVVDQEVGAKSGLSGMALKGAYASAKKMKDGIVTKGVNAMLPQVAAALAPYWDAKGDQDFGAHLAANSAEVSEKLLAMADGAAANPDNAAMAKI